MYLKVMMPKRFQFRMVPSFKNFLLDRKGDIHYIGGADVLPAPLEPAEEAEVIADLGPDSMRQCCMAAASWPERQARLPAFAAPWLSATVSSPLFRHTTLLPCAACRTAGSMCCGIRSAPCCSCSSISQSQNQLRRPPSSVTAACISVCCLGVSSFLLCVM